MSDHTSTRFKRVVVKLSGEALQGSAPAWARRRRLWPASPTISRRPPRRDMRSRSWSAAAISFAASRAPTTGIERARADSIGMLATVMNGLALEQAVGGAGAAGALPLGRAHAVPMRILFAPGGAASSRQGARRHRGRRHGQSLLHHGHAARCCAPRNSRPTPCSRPRRSTASTPPIPSATPPRSATSA